MPLTDEEVESIGKEVSEAVPALRKYFALGRNDQIKVMSRIADKMIGTDATAQIKSLPAMTPGMTESLTDMVIPLISQLFVRLLVGEEPA